MKRETPDQEFSAICASYRFCIWRITASIADVGDIVQDSCSTCSSTHFHK